MAKSAKGGSWSLTDANVRGYLIAGGDTACICFAARAATNIKFRSMQAKFEAKFEEFYSPRPAS